MTIDDLDRPAAERDVPTTEPELPAGEPDLPGGATLAPDAGTMHAAEAAPGIGGGPNMLGDPVGVAARMAEAGSKMARDAVEDGMAHARALASASDPMTAMRMQGEYMQRTARRAMADLGSLAMLAGGGLRGR